MKMRLLPQIPGMTLAVMLTLVVAHRAGVRPRGAGRQVAEA